MALREYRPERKFLFWSPPQDVLPPDHLCFIVDELVEALDFSLLADSGYYTKKNLEYLKREGIEGYLPSSEQARDGKDKYKPRRYSKDKFRYDEERDVYVCPEGKELRYWRMDRTCGSRLYRGERCKGCPVLKECVRGKKPYRVLSRWEKEPLMTEMRERMESEEGKRIYSKRKTMTDQILDI